MSNIMSQNLKNAIQSGQIGIIADVDGTLTPPGAHAELLTYNDRLVRAYDATMGAFMFLTNNDGRSVTQIIHQIARNAFTAIGCRDTADHFNGSAKSNTPEFSFPIVSECATRIRRWSYGKPITENAENVPELNFDQATCYLSNDHRYKKLVDGRLKDGRPFYQAKENTICLNYEAGDGDARSYLEGVCNDIIYHADIEGFEIKSLVDSVEIVPKGAHKKDVLDFLDKFPAFESKDTILMIGDTETDADVARELHAQGRGGMIAVGDSVADGPHILQRVESIEELMQLLDHVSLQIEANKKVAFYAHSKPKTALVHSR